MKILLQEYSRCIKWLSSFLLISFFIINVVVSQTITPATTLAAAEALDTTVLVGSGVRIIPGSTVYSGQFVKTLDGGYPGYQIGTFTGFSSTNLGINNGIIMSTGSVLRANQANTPASDLNFYDYFCTCEVRNGDSTCTLNHAGCQWSDSDLESILACVGCTFDAVSLEFSFIPSSNQINFNYVFASDEYPNYVCSTTNDIFAFLVTGPNPKPGPPYNKTNIALVPNTIPPEPVSMNTINRDICGAGWPYHLGCDTTNKKYYVPNANGNTIVYNAFTKVLTATLFVIPCDTYKIKLALADVVDGAYDSSVFLQAQSFTVKHPVITYLNPTLNTTSVLKGCGQAKITFNTNNGLGVQADSLVKLNLKGGKAVNGIDFTTTPAGIKDSIVITKGNNSYSFTINPLCTQPGKNLYALLNVITCGITSTDTIWITDVLPITATPINDTTICIGLSETLSVSNIAGGSGAPYSYSWTSNPAGFTSTVANPVVSPTVTTTYTVVISDACSACGTATENIVVTVAEPLVNAVAGGPTTFCKGGSVILSANPNTFITYDWQDKGVDFAGGVKDSITADSAGTYLVIVKDKNGCVSTSNTITVTISVPVATIKAEGPTGICKGSSVVLDANLMQGYFYQWLQGGVNIPGATNVSLTVDSTGIYSFTMTDNVNCNAKSTTIAVKVYNVPVATITPHGPFTTCTDTAVTIVANFVPNLFYQWQLNGMNQDGATNNVFVFNTIGYYTVIESDSVGCTGTDSISVTLKCPVTTLFAPNAFTPGNTLMNNLFLPVGNHIDIFEMDIYNRWGSKVFHSDSQSDGWDGRYNGSLCPIGVYVYYIRYEGYFSNIYEAKTKIGTITIVR